MSKIYDLIVVKIKFNIVLKKMLQRKQSLAIRRLRSIDPTRRASMSARVCEIFLQADMLGESYTMSLSKGVHQLPSRIGVLLSLFVSTILIVYSGFKIHIMIEKNDTVMHSITEEFYYNTDYVMDSSKNFYFAVALTGFDNEEERALDPSIAEIKFFSYEWDIHET